MGINFLPRELHLDICILHIIRTCNYSQGNGKELEMVIKTKFIGISSSPVKT